MENELKIEKFKKIYDSINLKNFDFVNYIVGENGSGKSSILNAISFLKDGSNSSHFFGPESKVNFRVGELNQFLWWNEDNPNHTEHNGDLNPNIYILLSNSNNEKGANGISSKINKDSRMAIGAQNALSEFNEFMDEIGLSKVVAKKFVDQENPFDQNNGRLIFETDKGTINPAFMADGITVLFILKKFLNEWIEKINQTNSVSFIIIEEPENNLHPNFQKNIPLLLNNLYKKLKPGLLNKVFFFVSTHSPFIISASAKFLEQKVYPLQNGKPLKMDFSQNSWIENNSSEGYKGSECAYIVSKMLGADITDIGYPENYCILEEYSLQIILDRARQKGIIKNIQFVSASGVSKSLDISETIYEIEKLNTLVKCNPYYFDKYYLVLDNLKNIKDDILKNRVNKIKERLNKRFIELSLNSLEDYYLNLDEKIGNEVKKCIASSDKNNVGLMKAKYARLIANKINSSESFSLLFNKELDFLLQ